MDKIITKEAIGELQKALTPVVTKLGQGGEFVYETYYKQQIVYGVLNMIEGILGLGILFATYKFYIYAFKKNKEEGSYSGWDLSGSLIGIFGSLLGITLILICFPEAIGRLINPDYYLLQELLSIVKK